MALQSVLLLLGRCVDFRLLYVRISWRVLTVVLSKRNDRNKQPTKHSEVMTTVQGSPRLIQEHSSRKESSRSHSLVNGGGGERPRESNSVNSSPSPSRKRLHPTSLNIDDGAPPNKRLHTPTVSWLEERCLTLALNVPMLIYIERIGFPQVMCRRA